MSKFKVGDKVKVLTNCIKDARQQAGYIGIITKCIDNEYTIDDEYLPMYEDEIELVGISSVPNIKHENSALRIELSEEQLNQLSDQVLEKVLDKLKKL